MDPSSESTRIRYFPGYRGSVILEAGSAGPEMSSSSRVERRIWWNAAERESRLTVEEAVLVVSVTSMRQLSVGF